MIHNQNAKRVLIINQASTTNGATQAGYVDLLGYDYAMISVYTTTSDAVSDKPATLRILETDATQPTAATNYATISGFVSGTDYTIPNEVTAATSKTTPYFIFAVDCKARKRYLRVEWSPVTTQSATIIADLSRPEQASALTNLATGAIAG